MRFDRKTFFDGFRELIDDSIEQEQVDGLEFLLGRMENDPRWKDVRHIAYALATTGHETAWSFQPVVEGYYLAKTDPPDYAGKTKRVKDFQKTLRYFPYFGRGYVQLTWKPNYAKAAKAFGLDLVNKPELALTKEVAYDVMTSGMHEGWFTGKKLTDFIKGQFANYKDARTIINGHDMAAAIAGYAKSFEKILRNSAAAPAVNPTEDRSGQSENRETVPATPSQPNDSGASGASTSTLEVGPDGIKAETSNTPVQNVVIEKRTEEGWLSTKKKEIAALLGGNTLLDGLVDRFKEFNALGLSAAFWQRVVYVALAATAVYLFVDWWKHRSKIREEVARDAILAKENSQPGNFVQFAPTEYLQEYRNRGYKVITR